MEMIEEKAKKPAIQVFEEAMKNLYPAVEQNLVVSVERPCRCRLKCNPHRQESLAMRWLIGAARTRPGKSMTEKLRRRTDGRIEQHRLPL